MANLPLDGIRICDLTSFWSGSNCTGYLGGIGAEVIKIESIQHPDGYRFGLVVFDNWWEAYGPWNSNNLNKYDVTLDLSRPRGMELLKQLIGISDVLIDNYSPRVMDAFGLTYPVVKEIKPDIVMISMPAYGTTGPWRNYAGFAFAFEQAAGLAQLTGYEDGAPQNVGGAGDPIAGMHAAFAIQLALEYRRQTGRGQHIDMSQTETIACLAGQAVSDWSMNKRAWGRSGNRDQSIAPHGVYRCKGDDAWVTIAVSSEEEWKSFCRALGNPEWAASDKFATATGRRENQDELDRLVQIWSVQNSDYEAMDILQKAGVAAGAVAKPHEALNEPQFKARGFFRKLTRDIVGEQHYPRWPLVMSETPVGMRPSPKLGEHNSYFLGQVLGLTNADLKELEEEQIIGTVPLAFGGVSG